MAVQEQPMGKVRVSAFSISIDGFGAGPRQDLQNPLGIRGLELHSWVFPTESFQKQHGQTGSKTEGQRGVDNDFAREAMEGLGAWVLGRNMFGPVRGAWVDESWKGWWGEEPPYHVPVFVLTHHRRAPLEMKGGTTFHFVTDGIESALAKARAAAGDKDIRIGGGVSTVRQYLAAGKIDEMHLAISPVVLGQGEHLFAGIDLPKLGFTVAKNTRGENATHVVLRK
jgi:dihydrofolate reductase